MELLKSGQADPNWDAPKPDGDNPVAWLIQVNGLIVDARHMPRDIQEEAFRLGLIPICRERANSVEVYALSPLKILWDFSVVCLNSPNLGNNLPNPANR